MSLRSAQRSQPAQTRPAGVQPPAPGKTVGKGGAVMISIDELERIKNSITKTNEDVYTTMRNADRQTLQETSKNRIKNWPNTMEALRLKREEDRIRRLEDEEVSTKKL
jgi:hypothetical protein